MKDILYVSSGTSQRSSEAIGFVATPSFYKRQRSKTSWLIHKFLLTVLIILAITSRLSFAQQWGGSTTVTGAIYRDGNVGIGTTNPGAALHVWKSANGNFPIAIEPGGWGVIGFNSFFTSGMGRVYAVNGYAGSIAMSSVDGSFRFATAANGLAGRLTGETDRMVITNDGNVGIGTVNPTAKLQVNDNIKLADAYSLFLERQNNHADAFILHNAQYASGDQTFRWTTNHSSFGMRGIRFSYLNGIHFFADAGPTTAGSSFTPTTKMFIGNNGNVGIGTSNPAKKLSVVGNSNDFQGVFEVKSSTNAGAVRLDGSSGGWLQMTNPGGRATLEISGSEPTYGAGIIHLKRDGGTSGVRISGRYPLPNTEHGGGIDVYGGSGAHNFELRGSFEGGNNGAWMALKENGAERITFAARNASTSVGGLIDVKNRNGVATVKLVGDNDNEAGLVITSVLQITGGSDLAESFDALDAESIKPGMVVAIDPEQPGHLRMADKAYDRTVAGIVSGANGINPGLTMSQEGTVAEGKLPVSLTGRVYCYADASNGPIVPGDLLTTSNLPGHAMKVTDHAKAQGAIIGKAMSSLNAGQGLVLVLVTLQ